MDLGLMEQQTVRLKNSLQMVLLMGLQKHLDFDLQTVIAMENQKHLRTEKYFQMVTNLHLVIVKLMVRMMMTANLQTEKDLHLATLMRSLNLKETMMHFETKKMRVMHL